MMASCVPYHQNSRLLRPIMGVWALGAIVNVATSILAADEVPKLVEDDSKQESTAPLESTTSTDQEQVAARIISSLAEASQRLDDGAIDGSTIALQQSAADDIALLLKNLRENSKPSAAQQPGDSSSQQAASGPSGRSNGRANQNRDAAQSNEQAREGGADQPENELTRRRNLAQSVWGHLPPKVQEELERSFSERFVPKYEELIRRYYEALAERRPEKP